MKKSVFLMALAVFFLTSVRLSAQNQSPIRDGSVKVSLEYVDSPEFAVVDSKNDSKSVSANKKKWLVLDVAFSMNGTKSKTTTSHQWLDDMIIEADMLVPCIYQKKPVIGLLSGKQVLWSIPIDGEEHRVRFFVPPFVIDRHFNIQTAGGDKRGIKLNKGGLKEIPVRILFKTKDQRPIGWGFQMSKEYTDKEKLNNDFESAKAALGVVKLGDSIFPPEKTPWAWLNSSVYEMTKDQGSR